MQALRQCHLHTFNRIAKNVMRVISPLSRDSQLNHVDGNKKISRHILSNRPLSIIRLRSETACLEWYKMDKYPSPIPASYEINGGLYPLTKGVIAFYAKTIDEGIKNSDYIAYWPIHDIQYKKYAKMYDFNLIHNRSVEPFYFDDPWSKYLTGKRILVVHPFTDTIEKQYKNRDKLFDNNSILPEFNLKLIKSIQSSGGGEKPHESWIKSLEYMIEQIKNVEFDVALLGCGCYDIPLSTEIKRMGKQSIVVGGGLQILFGIKGKRWNKHKIISGFYNKNWVRPSENETPKSFYNVENGCYW